MTSVRNSRWPRFFEMVLVAVAGIALVAGVVESITSPGTPPIWQRALHSILRTTGLAALWGAMPSDAKERIDQRDLRTQAAQQDNASGVQAADVAVGAELPPAGLPSMENSHGFENVANCGAAKGGPDFAAENTESAEKTKGFPLPSTTPGEYAPTPAETMVPPTETTVPTASATPSPDAKRRVLSLKRITVQPGGTFQVDLECDALERIAGCDIGLRLMSGGVQFTAVQRTGITAEFLLVKQLAPDVLTASLAAESGLSNGPGSLLVISGAALPSVTQTIQVPVRFFRAKLYDADSQPLPVMAEDGLIVVEADAHPPTEAWTPRVVQSRTPALPTAPSSDPPATRVPSPTPVTGTPDERDENAPDLPWEPVSVSTPTVTRTVTATPHTESPTPTAALAAQPAETPLRTDLDSSGRVDHLDLFLFMRHWQPAHQ